MYQNLSRKYRPQTFQSMVGQESIVTTLKNAILKGQIAPAYLFCGSRGTGKTTLARLFAKALNCETLGENQEPCNRCPSCLSIMQGKSLDVMEIDGASNRGIDDIRQINETIGYATAGGHYKIYIIDEVHMLTKEAFNALLKTLEEPPDNVKFLFATTEPQKVLPTILSRCQRFDLSRLTIKQISDKLTKIAEELQLSVEQGAIELISQVAEGGLRDAESLFDQLLCFEQGTITYASAAKLLGVAPRQFYFQLDKAIENNNLSAAFQLSSELFSTGRELQTFLEGLLDHFRIYLLLHLKIPLQRFLHPSEEEHYKQMLSVFTQDHLLYMLDYLTGWVKEMNKTPFKQVTLEMILLHLIRSMHRVSLPTLVRRLEELSSGQEEKRETESVLSNPPKELEVEREMPAEMALTSPALPQITKEIPLKEESFQPPLSSSPKELEVEREVPAEMALASPALPEIAKETPLSEESFQSPLSSSLKELETQPESKEEVSPVETAPAMAEEAAEEQPVAKPRSKGYYDTILRFAAVELEGILKKE